MNEPDPTHRHEHRGCRFASAVRGSGPPVLFIQGTGVHGDGWRPQVDGLSARYACLSFDNRGMGRSQPIGDAPTTVAQMAEDALAVMDAHGWDAAHVVGHSLGGPIALELALAAPARVKTLSLLCAFADGRDITRMSWSLLRMGLRTSVGTRRQRRRAFLEIVMPPDVLAVADQDALAQELEPLFGHDLADRPPIVGRQVAAMSKWNATGRLGRLAGIPTLVVAAAHDPIARPALGRALAEGIPGARFVLFPDAAHGVTIQHAERVNALLAEHFERGAAIPAASRVA
jgi:pimeloyl-ACP methyl ester carboxylesterase